MHAVGAGRGVESLARLRCRDRGVQAQGEQLAAQVGVDQAFGAQQLHRVGVQSPTAARGQVQVLGADAHHLKRIAARRLAQEVHGRRAHEAGDKGAGRAVVDLFGCAELFHHAAVHDDHALRQSHGFDLVVRDKQAGDAQLAVQFLNFQPGLGAQFGVQVGQRFIKQKHLWLAHDGPAHGHALALAA